MFLIKCSRLAGILSLGNLNVYMIQYCISRGEKSEFVLVVMRIIRLQGVGSIATMLLVILTNIVRQRQHRRWTNVGH